MKKAIYTAEFEIMGYIDENMDTIKDSSFVPQEGDIFLTPSEIILQISELAKHNALQYQRDRKAKYDALNQDEMRFDDTVNGTTIWVDTILAIKAEFPKPV